MLKYVRRQALRIISFILLLIVYLINSAQLQLATQYAKTSPGTAEKYLGVMLITIAGILVLFTWLYQRQLNRNNPRQFGKRPITFNRLIQLCLLFVVMLLVQIIWSQLIMHHLLPMPSNQTAVESSIQQLPFWNNLYGVLVAPVFEEFLFRGVFFNFFFSKNNRWSTFFGVLVSGLLFGYLHTLSFSTTTLFYASLGWLLAITYLRFKDIRYNIALHFLNNFWSIL